MSYAMMRLKFELIGFVMLAVGVGGITASFYLGFWNWQSAGAWIVGLMPLLKARRYSEAGVWTGTIMLGFAFLIAAICVLYCLAGLCFSPLALWELAVYAPRDPARLGEGAFLFVVGYVLPAVVWLRIFLEWE